MRPLMTTDLRPLTYGFGLLVAVALIVAVMGRDDGSGTPDDTTAETSDTAPADSTTSTTSTTTTSTTTTTTTLDPRLVTLGSEADEFLASITPEELAYRLVVTGLNGSNLENRLSGTVGSPCVGGLFLTESNDNWLPEGDPAAFRAAREALDTTVWADDACPYPPLITTDAELGSIVRVPATSPPGAPEWTARYINGTPYDVLIDLQNEVGTYAGQLRDLGIDINFGVVADVATDPGHFMARQGRTFGDDPGLVSALSGAVVNGHCDAGVAATLKHFPNQGDTIEDPHRQRSTAVGGREEWETTGRLPYEFTTAPVVMTGHIFMDIDPFAPASMSPTVTGLLRNELGYDGVVITDDLSTMRGASDAVADPGGRAVAAIRAGADLVLFVVDRDIPGVVAALTAEMETDPAFLDRSREALERVVDLHQRLAEPELLPLCVAGPRVSATTQASAN